MYKRPHGWYPSASQEEEWPRRLSWQWKRSTRLTFYGSRTAVVRSSQKKNSGNQRKVRKCFRIPPRGGDDASGALDLQCEQRFWRRKLNGITLDIAGKKCYLIKFKRTRDRRHSYEEQVMEVARQQYKSLLNGLQTVGQQKGWKVEHLVFLKKHNKSQSSSTLW